MPSRARSRSRSRRRSTAGPGRLAAHRTCWRPSASPRRQARSPMARPSAAAVACPRRVSLANSGSVSGSPLKPTNAITVFARRYSGELGNLGPQLHAAHQVIVDHVADHSHPVAQGSLVDHLHSVPRLSTQRGAAGTVQRDVDRSAEIPPRARPLPHRVSRWSRRWSTASPSGSPSDRSRRSHSTRRWSASCR